MIQRELFVSNRDLFCRLHVPQAQNAQSIKFHIADWTVPSGATAQIYIKKPSGSIIYNAGTVSGNAVTFPTTTQMTAEVGVAEGQLRIVSGSSILHSFLFELIVEESIIDDDAIESTDEFTALEEALEEVQDCVTKTSVKNIGSATRPVYFDANGQAQAVDAPTVGSATQGIYLNNGMPNAMTYSVNKTVPADALFTDTTVLTSMTGILPLANGGTGASTAAAARTNLGVDAALETSNLGTSLPQYGGNIIFMLQTDYALSGVTIPAYTIGWITTFARSTSTNYDAKWEGISPDGGHYTCKRTGGTWSLVSVDGIIMERNITGTLFNVKLCRNGNVVSAFIASQTNIEAAQTEASIIPSGFRPWVQVTDCACASSGTKCYGGGIAVITTTGSIAMYISNDTTISGGYKYELCTTWVTKDKWPAEV